MACQGTLAALTLLGVGVVRRVVPYTCSGFSPIFVEGPISNALSPGVGTLHHVGSAAYSSRRDALDSSLDISLSAEWT